jgi:putative glutamine amidotransferase
MNEHTGGAELVTQLNTTSHSNGRAPSGAVIAISALKRAAEKCGRFPTSYVTAARLAGARCVVLSPFEELHAEDEVPPDVVVRHHLDPGDATLLDDVSGLILPGGGDVDPSFYGHDRHPRTTDVNVTRDRFEFALLELALERDLPVLAICRGMQLLNVALGGTLEQHLGDRPGRLPHDRDRPRAEPAHKLRVAEDSELARILDTTETAVNSHHHQGLEDVAGELAEVAWAEDGVLEAVESRDHGFLIGVQWHPEGMAPVDRTQAAIFRHFLEASASSSSAPRRASRVPSG